VAIMAAVLLLRRQIPREAILAAVRHWRLHFTILSSTFILFPLFVLGLRLAFPAMLAPMLWIGVIYLSVLPSTVQSSILFTSIAGGNVAGAIAAASASNLLGIVITPLLTSLLVHGTSGTATSGGIASIFGELLLPFALGQLLRPKLLGFIERNRELIGYSDRSAILLAVYSAFFGRRGERHLVPGGSGDAWAAWLRLRHIAWPDHDRHAQHCTIARFQPRR